MSGDAAQLIETGIYSPRHAVSFLLHIITGLDSIFSLTKPNDELRLKGVPNLRYILEARNFDHAGLINRKYFMMTRTDYKFN